ncbi:hypothetical protein IVB18_21270 [Bradyrhizobium sp. 186]|uniref:hypothetical protein n=1 Tax=Bradyrhizobium sp. 186 TaxID=2782654 RepID=UPI00200089CC|nr:hypothetical protein [Bradyrhizobium sp. 186]UPK39526.1 hypothetical protein IVB18_21270 [Bradyrhizobium sp. 186]
MSGKKDALNKKYKAAANRVTEVERQLETVSKIRLAELLKLSKAQRLNAFDDPDLLPNERHEIRKSILIGDAPPKWQAVTWRARAIFRRSRARLLSSLLGACYVAVFIVPIGWLFYAVWRNTGQLIVASSPMTVDWRMPTGEIIRRIVPAGESLVLMMRPDGSYFFRKWHPQQGYAIAEVNVAPHP